MNSSSAKKKVSKKSKSQSKYKATSNGQANFTDDEEATLKNEVKAVKGERTGSLCKDQSVENNI